MDHNLLDSAPIRRLSVDISQDDPGFPSSCTGSSLSIDFSLPSSTFSKPCLIPDLQCPAAIKQANFTAGVAFSPFHSIHPSMIEPCMLSRLKAVCRSLAILKNTPHSRYMSWRLGILWVKAIRCFSISSNAALLQTFLHIFRFCNSFWITSLYFLQRLGHSPPIVLAVSVS